jgi:hypothetical protein
VGVTLPVDPVLPDLVSVGPVLPDLVSVGPLLPDLVSVGPLLTVPLLVEPLPPVPVLFDPVAGPSDAVSVGLVLALPEPGELDVGVAGVEETLPGLDEDAGAFGCLLAVLDGLAVLVAHGVAVALADALPPLPPVLAFAEAFEVAMLIVVALAVPGAGAVAVSPGLVLLPSGPPLVPLPVALSDGVFTGLAGVSLGVADVVGLALAGLAGADDAELVVHAGAGTPPWAAEVPTPAPPVAEPMGVPSPFVL